MDSSLFDCFCSRLMRSTSSGTHPLAVLTAGRLVSSNALILTEVGKGLEGSDHDCATCSHVYVCLSVCQGFID